MELPHPYAHTPASRKRRQKPYHLTEDMADKAGVFSTTHLAVSLHRPIASFLPRCKGKRKRSPHRHWGSRYRWVFLVQKASKKTSDSSGRGPFFNLTHTRIAQGCQCSSKKAHCFTCCSKSTRKPFARRSWLPVL